jgi:hypothetical protein
MVNITSGSSDFSRPAGIRTPWTGSKDFDTPIDDGNLLARQR